MIPIPVRIAVVALGCVLLFGSWFIGNSVDAGLRIGSVKSSPLEKDALTFGARVIGAFLIGIGLLMWVVAKTVQTRAGFF